MGANVETMEHCPLLVYSYRIQDNQPNDGITHNGLNPPKQITSSENAL